MVVIRDDGRYPYFLGLRRCIRRKCMSHTSRFTTDHLWLSVTKHDRYRGRIIHFPRSCANTSDRKIKF